GALARQQLVRNRSTRRPRQQRDAVGIDVVALAHFLHHRQHVAVCRVAHASNLRLAVRPDDLLIVAPFAGRNHDPDAIDWGSTENAVLDPWQEIRGAGTAGHDHQQRWLVRLVVARWHDEVWTPVV